MLNGPCLSTVPSPLVRRIPCAFPFLFYISSGLGIPASSFFVSLFRFDNPNNKRFPRPVNNYFASFVVFPDSALSVAKMSQFRKYFISIGKVLQYCHKLLKSLGVPLQMFTLTRTTHTFLKRSHYVLTLSNGC